MHFGCHNLNLVVHRGCHNLNLVVNDAATTHVMSENFFAFGPFCLTKQLSDSNSKLVT